MIVPFGRFKGQPVERLLADGSYCDWLLQQDWFGNYGDIVEEVRRRFAPQRSSYQKGVDAVWEFARRNLPPDEFWRLDARARGCTCRDRIELVTGDDGEVLGEDHADDCPRGRKLAADRERAERREALPRCHGARSDGEPCRALVRHGTEYCHHHRDQADGVPRDVIVAIARAVRKVAVENGTTPDLDDVADLIDAWKRRAVETEDGMREVRHG